jgi:hypothetical protein
LSLGQTSVVWLCTGQRLEIVEHLLILSAKLRLLELQRRRDRNQVCGTHVVFGIVCFPRERRRETGTSSRLRPDHLVERPFDFAAIGHPFLAFFPTPERSPATQLAHRFHRQRRGALKTPPHVRKTAGACFRSAAAVENVAVLERTVLKPHVVKHDRRSLEFLPVTFTCRNVASAILLPRFREP